MRGHKCLSKRGSDDLLAQICIYVELPELYSVCAQRTILFSCEEEGKPCI